VRKTFLPRFCSVDLHFHALQVPVSRSAVLPFFSESPANEKTCRRLSIPSSNVSAQGSLSKGNDMHFCPSASLVDLARIVGPFEARIRYDRNLAVYLNCINSNMIIPTYPLSLRQGAVLIDHPCCTILTSRPLSLSGLFLCI